ncbi:putative sporulation protein YtxC [Oceanobacillus polygoni]|uniref:Sporulation protein YtxC n=1 Tax=Oceanobacillus polygoni TaxID=1235259 RepID=A0A9X0YUE6_9BACI|nr:putative sporulation protein YtxC [Oceanobacillus polygoni]MBP2077369.1 putative sporulation protein YtxC [Oceanobacillus polygoni]
MLEVYFESDKEVISFCEHLFRRHKQIELNWKTDDKWGNHLQFKQEVATKELMDAITDTMAKVFMTHRLSTMVNRIIQDYYYYTNNEEIERIHDLTYWIITGEDEESKRLRENKDHHAFLKSMFTVSLKESFVIHFDSIVNFRLKPFKDKLIYFVGLAIDEFRREEDHQAFVDMLRAYVEKKDPGLPVIHILQGSDFAFFKQNGKRMTNMELRVLMKQEPLYIVGLHDNEFNLTPLIAMAPEKLKIYGDDPSEPKTLTVINVFQEKVDFEPISNFPFTYNLNK